MTDFSEFIAVYRQSFAPARLSPWVIPEEAYVCLSCYKDDPECKVLLVENMAGERFILKAAANQRGQALEREYRFLSRQRSPYFPQAFRFFERDGQAFLLREYIPGKTLAAYAEERSLSCDEIVRWALEVCSVVTVLHGQDPPLIHRDIKPQNFVVTQEKRLVMIDLDSVQAYAPDKQADTILMGTPGTAAPEQFGARRSDVRADVYGIGMLMLYLLTNDVDLKALGRHPVPRWLKRLILRCTGFDPANRYVSIAKLEHALRAAEKRRRRRAARIAACGLAALLLYACSVYVTEAATRQTYARSSYADTAAVAFTEPLIEKAAAYQLGKEPGTITRGDLRSVHTLLLCGDTPFDEWEQAACFNRDNIPINGVPHDAVRDGNVVSLADLAMMPNLRKLALHRQNITDISALEGLPLTHLGLAANPIRDFSVLEKLPSLLAVELGATGFLDANLLAGCKSLRLVRLSDTPVFDLRPLTGLPISELFVHYDAIISDPEVLEEFSSLACLKTCNVSSAGIEVIGRLSRLERLELGGSYLGSLEPLLGLSSLQQLFIGHSGVVSLDGIERLSRLQTVWIYSCAVRDLSPLVDLPLLHDLDISNVPVDDLTVLKSLPGLGIIRVARHQVQAISALGLSARIEVTL